MVDKISYVIDEDDLDIFQRRKKKRLISIKAMLKKLQKTDLKTFVAKVSAENGFYVRTMKEYLSLLEDAGSIKIRNGQISWIEEEKPKQKKSKRSSQPK